MKLAPSVLTTLAALAATSSALACPDGQVNKCITRDPFSGRCIASVCLPNTPNPEDVACEPVGIAGAAGYSAAASFQRGRHGGGVALHPRFKHALRPEFGDLVDRVRLHYSATMLDAIRAGSWTISQPSDGQTFGLDIYLNMNEADATLSLIAHEMHHTRQWQSRGEDVSRFGRDYFNDWCKASFSYESNKFERDAREVGARFPAVVLAQLPDPPPPVFEIQNQPIVDFASWARAPGAQTVAADVDGDGRDDVVMVGGAGWGTIPVAFSHGNGAFRVTNAVASDFATWAAAGGRAVAGDFDGDGRDDIALTGGRGWGTIPVAFSNGDGSFRISNLEVVDFAGWAERAAHVVSGDFDGDGRADIALVGGSGWGTLPVAFSRGDGTFHVTNHRVSDIAGWALVPGAQAAAGDFDGDGKTDIALAGGQGWGTIPVAFSRGTGVFHTTNAAASAFADVARSGAKLLATDVNGDGASDLVLAGGPGWTTLPRAISVGGGLFRYENPSAGELAGWAALGGVRAVAGDFDGNRRGDVALTGGPGWGTLPVAFSR